ncbi:lipoprotein signal peptidase [Aliiroseovarius crassostreae]|uniref:Lipoprotein signal peptidase n=1 Tax=Aliiroseovarius crassostreae TaxID=154981 RepID=A0A0P7KIR5_9RHOB|nr:signal peptidase II [Aliiroseovarius crassostreae]KPN61832.1 lipoprotein signal peptidase [Aliiroseovarius crassostreae]
MRVIALFAALSLLIDQGSKFFVLNVLDLTQRGWLEVFPPFLNFQMAWNRGVNFGLFGSDGAAMRWVLIVLALGISGWVVRWVIKTGAGRLALISAGLLVGGALGNVVDRVIYGAVVDFLNMSCCGFQNPYSFNVADIFVFAGAFGLALFADPAKSE